MTSMHDMHVWVDLMAALRGILWIQWVLSGPAVIGFFANSRGIGVAFGGVACLLALVALSAFIAVPDRRP
jgi:hypothetical protein